MITNAGGKSKHISSYFAQETTPSVLLVYVIIKLLGNQMHVVTRNHVYRKKPP